GAAGASVEAAVAQLASGFDAAARISPDASVALYSLGDPTLLAAATAELVAWIRQAGLLGADRRLLDIGCGAGRLEVALHGDVGRIVGIDVSAELLAVARRRCRGLGNVELRRGSGLDLGGLPDNDFDAVIAVDSFPYLVAAGGDLAARHFAESARVLRPAGDLVIFNYSYRGAPTLDRNDVGALGAAAGFRVVENGGRPFVLWDGAVFRLVRR
ncbi:MAG: methyltransferase domain-containing protein, partial [Rhodobacteraceae bacterium]|nr:methyltransferase domain-containing protein [Paracoccaceae bacterium]